MTKSSTALLSGSAEPLPRRRSPPPLPRAKKAVREFFESPTQERSTSAPPVSRRDLSGCPPNSDGYHILRHGTHTGEEVIPPLADNAKHQSSSGVSTNVGDTTTGQSDGLPRQDEFFTEMFGVEGDPEANSEGAVVCAGTDPVKLCPQSRDGDPVLADDCARCFVQDHYPHLVKYCLCLNYSKPKGCTGDCIFAHPSEDEMPRGGECYNWSLSKFCKFSSKTEKAQAVASGEMRPKMKLCKSGEHTPLSSAPKYLPSLCHGKLRNDGPESTLRSLFTVFDERLQGQGSCQQQAPPEGCGHPQGGI